MTPHIKIRSATSIDAEALAKINIENWQISYRGYIDEEYLKSLDHAKKSEGWKKYLSNIPKNQLVLVAEDHFPVGYASGTPLENEPNTTYELKTLYVAIEQQRKGIGRQLLKEIAQQIINQGATRIILWTLKNGPSHGFYSKLGAKLRPKTTDKNWGGKNYLCVSYEFNDLKELISIC